MLETVSKSRFKAKALEYFRKIEQNGQALIITDHGKPVLKIAPFEEKPQLVLQELRNSVLRFDDPLEPVALDDWDALK
ncbi:type II toxin-antitoxin system Phd/YefM family antitoxin [Desulfobulbus sp. F4]|nr:type II toxin-antitoxin system Phd/YefM family antitoxin [Desulfobulbus sp. F3]MCW5200631.1 type II toxin-antitoxin system Phd/YefM family antitoxin [Desulfobulbus sp. F4]